MANAEFREEVDAEIHGRDSFQSKEGLETRWSSVLLLETRGSTGLFGAEFRREFFLSLPYPGAIMNHKASSMETWNSLWKELKTYVIPKDEAGLSVRGSGEELRILGARRPAPVRPPPSLRPASFVSSTLPGTSQSGALRLLGRQLGTRQRSRPGALHFPS